MNIIFRDQIYKPYPIKQSTIWETLFWLSIIAIEAYIITIIIKYY